MRTRRTLCLNLLSDPLPHFYLWANLFQFCLPSLFYCPQANPSSFLNLLLDRLFPYWALGLE